MMSLRRAAAIAAASLVTGCALLTGAADLEVGSFPEAAPEAALPEPAPEASLPRFEAGMADSSVPDAPVLDGNPGTRLRTVTFENGKLTGALGADTELGTPGLQSFPSALAGKYSASLSVGDGLEVAFGTSLNEVFVTFLIALDGNVSAKGLFLRLGATSMGGANPVDLELSGDRSRALQAKVGAVSFGPAGALSAGTTYRVGVHAQILGTLTTVEVFLAPKGQAFSAPIVSGAASGSAALSSLRVGAFQGDNVQCTVDDILVDRASMPAP